jgi:hypothetical protein
VANPPARLFRGDAPSSGRGASERIVLVNRPMDRVGSAVVFGSLAAACASTPELICAEAADASSDAPSPDYSRTCSNAPISHRFRATSRASGARITQVVLRALSHDLPQNRRRSRRVLTALVNNPG